MSPRSATQPRCALCGGRNVSEPRGEEKYCPDCWDKKIAVEDIVASSSELLLYSVKNVTAGTDSQGEVSVRLQQNDRIGNGVGSDTDIVIASVKAYVNALNKLKTQGDRLNQKRGSGV